MPNALKRNYLLVMATRAAKIIGNVIDDIGLPTKVLLPMRLNSTECIYQHK